MGAVSPSCKLSSVVGHITSLVFVETLWRTRQHKQCPCAQLRKQTTSAFVQTDHFCTSKLPTASFASLFEVGKWMLRNFIVPSQVSWCWIPLVPKTLNIFFWVVVLHKTIKINFYFLYLLQWLLQWKHSVNQVVLWHIWEGQSTGRTKITGDKKNGKQPRFPQNSSCNLSCVLFRIILHTKDSFFLWCCQFLGLILEW